MSGLEWKGSEQSIPKRDRLHQIHRWLIHEYGKKSRLRVEKLPKDHRDCLGYVDLEPRIPLIRISKYISRSEAISVLLHEYCHVLSHYKHGPHWYRNHEGHDQKFYKVLCEVENRYFYDGGNVESSEY